MIFNELKYKERLNDLHLDLSNKFSDLLEESSTFNFVEKFCNVEDSEDVNSYIEELQEQDAFDNLPLIEVRNGITGNIFSVYVLSVNDNNGLFCSIMDNPHETEFYSFYDLADARDKINLLSEMQNCL